LNKIKKYKILLILISFFIFSNGCSTSTETVKREIEKKDIVNKYVNEVNLELGENIAWINKMPGTQPKFHVSGKIKLLENSNYEVSKTNLKFIKIYQSGKEIFYIIPKVVEKIIDDKKEFTYSTIKGLNVVQDLILEKPIRFELIFIQGKNEMKYYIKGIKVEEVF
jgi:hypothetical protein